MVPQKLLTAEMVSERLSICLSQIYRLARSGALAAVKIGRSVRFREEDVDRFILNKLQNEELPAADNTQVIRQVGR